MKRFNLAVVFICIGWDMYTTIIGTATIFGIDNIYMGVILALVIIFFALNTKPMLNLDIGGGFFAKAVLLITKLIWLIAIVYDFVTSYLGNRFLISRHLHLNNGAIDHITVIIFTLITSGVPVVYSLFKKGE